jgi:GNAT superfamily N-acetyltransferase
MDEYTEPEPAPDVRKLVPDDESVLTELARSFSEEGDTRAFEDWGKGLPTDYGLAELDADGHVKGAMWYRRDVYNEPEVRELFVAVYPAFWRTGVATRLWPLLRTHAVEDRPVELLVGGPAHRVAVKLLRRSGFENGERWSLDLGLLRGDRP